MPAVSCSQPVEAHEFVREKRLPVIRNLPERDIHHATVHPVRAVDDINWLIELDSCRAVIDTDPD